MSFSRVGSSQPHNPGRLPCCWLPVPIPSCLGGSCTLHLPRCRCRLVIRVEAVCGGAFLVVGCPPLLRVGGSLWPSLSWRGASSCGCHRVVYGSCESSHALAQASRTTHLVWITAVVIQSRVGSVQPLHPRAVSSLCCSRGPTGPKSRHSASSRRCLGQL